jgi:hypothetical protein
MKDEVVISFIAKHLEEHLIKLDAEDATWLVNFVDDEIRWDKIAEIAVKYVLMYPD